MVKFTCTEENMSLKPLFDLNKIMSRQPKRKLIPGCSFAFKNSMFFFLKKRRKDGLCLRNDIFNQAMRGKIMSIMGHNQAVNSNDASPTSIQARLIPIRDKSSHRVLLVLYASLINTNVFASYAVVIVVAVLARTALLFSNLLQIPKYWKWLNFISAIQYFMTGLLMNEMKGTNSVEGNLDDISIGEPQIRKLHNSTSAVPNWISKLINKDALFSVDVYSIDNFVISLCVLLVWGVLCGFYLFVVRMFYPKNIRK